MLEDPFYSIRTCQSQESKAYNCILKSVEDVLISSSIPLHIENYIDLLIALLIKDDSYKYYKEILYLLSHVSKDTNLNTKYFKELFLALRHAEGDLKHSLSLSHSTIVLIEHLLSCTSSHSLKASHFELIRCLLKLCTDPRLKIRTFALLVLSNLLKLHSHPGPFSDFIGSYIIELYSFIEKFKNEDALKNFTDLYFTCVDLNIVQNVIVELIEICMNLKSKSFCNHFIQNLFHSFKLLDEENKKKAILVFISNPRLSLISKSSVEFNYLLCLFGIYGMQLNAINEEEASSLASLIICNGAELVDFNVENLKTLTPSFGHPISFYSYLINALIDSLKNILTEGAKFIDKFTISVFSFLVDHVSLQSEILDDFSQFIYDISKTKQGHILQKELNLLAHYIIYYHGLHHFPIFIKDNQTIIFFADAFVGACHKSYIKIFCSKFLPLISICSNSVLPDIDVHKICSLRTKLWNSLPSFFSQPYDLELCFESIFHFVSNNTIEEDKLVISRNFIKAILNALESDPSGSFIISHYKLLIPYLLSCLDYPDSNSKKLICEIFSLISNDQLENIHLQFLSNFNNTGHSQDSNIEILRLLNLMIEARPEKLSFIIDYDILNTSNLSGSEKYTKFIFKVIITTLEVSKDFEWHSKVANFLATTNTNQRNIQKHRLVAIFALKTSVKQLLIFIPEIILATKDPNQKTRIVAFQKLVDWSKNALDISLNFFLHEFISSIFGCLVSKSQHMISASIIAFSRIFYEFNCYFEHLFKSDMIQNICILLKSSSREIIKSCLGFFKVLIMIEKNEFLSAHSERIVNAILTLPKNYHQNFKVKIRTLLLSLSKKIGIDFISQFFPKNHIGLLMNLKKRITRSKIKKHKKDLTKSPRLQNNFVNFEDFFNRDLENNPTDTDFSSE